MTITQTITKPAAPDERVVKRNPLQKLLGRPEVGALVGAIVLFVFFASVSQTFIQPNALATVLYGSSTIGIMAVGVSLLMIGGEFDLSTGVAVISSALTASMFSWYFSMNVWVGVALALVVSVGIGYINGWILMKTKLPSFIVTLATFLMLTGLNLGLTRMIGGGVSSPSISTMDGYASAQAVFSSSVNIGGVDVKNTVFIWIALVAVASWVLLRTKVGNWIFASGGDANAARAVGVPVTKTKIGLFMAVGFCGWILIKTKLPSFIVTLATFLMLTGLNLALTRLIGGSVSSPSISKLDGFESARAVFASSISIGGVEVKITVFFWIILVAVASWVLLRTKVGNWIFAVGGNADSARAVGVPVTKPRSGCSWRSGSAAGSWACTTCSRSTPCSRARAWATSSSTLLPR